MSKEEALQIVFGAAATLAGYKVDGDTICFNNDIDEADGIRVLQALALLTPRASDVVRRCHNCGGTQFFKVEGSDLCLYCREPRR